MPLRLTVRFAEVAFVTALATIMLFSWRADRRDRAHLADELAATKQLLTAADARQHDRDAQLAQTLAALSAEKRAIVTPAQIVRDLPNQIPLPAPITLQADRASTVGATLGSPAANASTAATGEASLAPTSASSAPSVATSTQSSQKPLANAIIPAADLKPLYDFALDCKACQAKLSSAQNDLTDERLKSAALTKERDDALRAVKGGSAWRRVARAAKWFVIGAAAGALAAKSAH